jgi:hypothetical protein
LDHLGTVIRGAETCKLGAAVHGAEVRVHFLKSFQEGRICEILSQKGQKTKKSGTQATQLVRSQWDQRMWAGMQEMLHPRPKLLFDVRTAADSSEMKKNRGGRRTEAAAMERSAGGLWRGGGR